MPVPPETPTVAVIGSGLAGLSVAGELHARRFSVRLFDKGRLPGGRASTRRSPVGWFDHGAQYFTARTPEFRRMVDDWVERGVVGPFDGPVVALGSDGLRPTPPTDRYVGRGGMAALAHDLAQGLEIDQSWHVARLERRGSFWWVRERDGRSEGPFRTVLVTAPAPQSAILLSVSPELSRRAASVRMRPTWAGMVTFDRPVPVEFRGAFVNVDSPLSWIARQPEGETVGERWVLHASPAWSEANRDESPEVVAERLTSAFRDLVPELPRPRTTLVHRWMFAIPDPALPEPFLFDPALGLGAAGDWCGGPRIEGAVRSGLALAGAVGDAASAARASA